MTEVTQKKTRQTIKGTVVSDKMSKTRVIEVNRNVRHRLYHKNIKQSIRFFVHDEKNEAKVGDVILAASTRPLSRHKTFRLVKVLEKRVGA